MWWETTQDPTDGSVRDQLILFKDNLVCEDEGVGGVQPRAIQCEEKANGITIEDNRVSGHAQPQISSDSSMDDIIVRRNPGFRSAMEGTTLAAYPGGASSGTVTIDLASSLDIADVVMTLHRRRFHAQLATSGAGYGGGYLNYAIEKSSPTSFTIHWQCGVPRSLIEFDFEYAEQ